MNWLYGFVLALGGASTFANLRESWLSRRSWIATEGTVLSSGVVGHGGELWFGSPAIEYEYKAGGRSRRGSRYGFGGPIDHEAAKAIARAHPTGSSVKVYYDSRNPSLACLEPKPHLLSLFLKLSGGLLCVVLAGFVLWKDFTEQPGEDRTWGSVSNSRVQATAPTADLQWRRGT